MAAAVGGGALPPDGGGPSIQPPEETKYDANQLAMLHAAMMEELGITRKDTLPLEDRGPAIHIPNVIKRPSVNNPNNPVNQWQNVQFDDFNPEDEALDSIADGQLYRLRRGIAGRQNVSDRGGHGFGRGKHSPVRGRGGSSRGGRGGGSGRGGRAGGQMGHANSPSKRNHFVHPQTFFNDVRRRAQNSQVKIDSFINKLRSLPTVSSAPENHEQQGRQNQQPLANAVATRRVPLATSIFARGLATNEDFSARFGLHTSSTPNKDVSSTVVPEAAVPSSPNVSTREVREISITHPKVRLPQTPERPNVQKPSTQRVTAEEGRKNAMAKENQRPAAQSGQVGLSGSRWGADTGVHRDTPLSNTATPSPRASRPISVTTTMATSNSSSKSGHTLARSDGSVHRQNDVKISRNRGQETRGVARLVKNNPEVDQNYTIELEIGGRKVLNEELDSVSSVTWKLHGASILYQAANDESTNLPSITWTIKFQMPYMANNFYSPVLTSTRSRIRSHHESETKPSPAPSITAVSQPTAPIQMDPPAVSSRCSSIQLTLNPETAPDRAADQKVEGVWGRKLEGLLVKPANRDTKRSPAPAPNFLENSPPSQGGTAMPSNAAHSPSFELSFHHLDSDVSSSGFLDRYHNGGSHRISSQAFSEMTQVGGIEPLISFSEDETTPLPDAPAWCQILLGMDDTALIQSTYDHFESQPQGSFLDVLSRIVALMGAPPAVTLTGEQILSSPQYQQAAEHLIGAFLSKSEIFARMPDIFLIHFTIEKSGKVLKLAVALRQHNLNVADSTAAQHSADRAEGFQAQAETLNIQEQINTSIFSSGLSNSYWARTPTTEFPSNSGKSQSSTSSASTGSSRITYTSDVMLNLRSKASRFQSELISGEVIDYVLRSPDREHPVRQPHNPPMNDIRRLPNGRSIVAGRDEMQNFSGRGDTSNPVRSSMSVPSSRVGRHIPTNSDLSRLGHSFKKLHVSNQQKETSSMAQNSTSSPQSPVAARLFAESISTSHVEALTAKTQSNQLPSPSAARMSEKITEFLNSPSTSGSKPSGPSPSANANPLQTCGAQSSMIGPAMTTSGTNFITSTRGGETSVKTESPVSKGIVNPFKNPHFKMGQDATERFQHHIQNSTATSGKKYFRNDLVGPVLNEQIAAVNNSKILSDRGSSREVLGKHFEKSEAAIKDEQVTPAKETLPRRASQTVFDDHFGILEATKTRLSESVSAPIGVSGAPESDSFAVKNEPRSPDSKQTKNVIETANQTAVLPVQERTASLPPEIKTEQLKEPASFEVPLPVLQSVTPPLETVSYKSVKGGAGLKASMWVTDEPIKKVARQADVVCQPPMHNQTFAPVTPNRRQFYNPLNTGYSPKKLAASIIPQYPALMTNHPGLTTILIEDPANPGQMIYVTGPPVAFDPQTMMSMVPVPVRQENFPHRPTQSHKREDSFGAPVTPVRQDTSTLQSRQALSPIRQNDNVQAVVQSRLDASLSGRSPNASS